MFFFFFSQKNCAISEQHPKKTPLNHAHDFCFSYQVLKAPTVFYQHFTENNHGSSQWFHTWPLKVRAQKYLLKALNGLNRVIYSTGFGKQYCFIVLIRAVLPEPQMILLNPFFSIIDFDYIHCFSFVSVLILLSPLTRLKMNSRCSCIKINLCFV